MQMHLICVASMHVLYIVLSVTPYRPLVIFNILGKYQVFKIADWRFKMHRCFHNTSRALIFLYPYNWKWQTDLICHFPAHELSFFCVFLPGTNAQTRRFANSGTSRSVSLPLYFDGADDTRLLFLYLLPSLFSFVFNIQGEDKMVAGGDENKSHPSLFIRHEKDTQ